MDFFNFFFRDTMWGQIGNQMNEYALQRQQRLGPDAVARMEHPDYKDLHARTYGNLSA